MMILWIFQSMFENETFSIVCFNLNLFLLNWVPCGPERCVKFFHQNDVCHLSWLMIHDGCVFIIGYISIFDLHYSLFQYYDLFILFLSFLRELFKFVIYILTYFLPFCADINFISTSLLFLWCFIYFLLIPIFLNPLS